MKTQSTTLLSTLTKSEIKSLTTQVQETLALNTHVAKTFTAVDLWSIQKQRKSFLTRRQV